MSLSETPMPATVAAPSSQFRTLTVMSLVLLALSVLWAVVDPRTIEGVPVWMKPLKFALSFVVVFATLALVEARLSPRARGGWTLRVTGWVMATAYLGEMAYMFYRAARAERSHFNMATPFEANLYYLMGVGAVSLVLGVAVVGWVAYRDGDARMGAGLREGVWLGFLASFVLTLIAAGYMSVHGGHVVGVHPTGAPTLPLLGWSGVTGDLRPAHFASIHAMQVLPLLGLWLDWRGASRAVRAVRIAAVGHAGVTLALFGQALAGLPLVPLG